MKHVKAQRAAVVALHKFTGIVRYDYQSSDQPTPPGPPWMRAWLGDDFFAEVDFVCLACDKSFTDATMECLGSLPRLKVLRLGHAAITDAGLENVKCLSQLEELSLGGNKITDVGLECLKALSQLKTLDLRGTKVTDEGVKQLGEALPNCEIHH